MNITAFTAETQGFPPYISINRNDDGTVAVSIRQSPVQGRAGAIAQINIPEAKWPWFCAEILLELERRPRTG